MAARTDQISNRRRQSREVNEGSLAEREEKAPLWKSLIAEFIGTFFLTFVSAAPIVVDAISGPLTNVDKVVPAGMVVAAMIYALGPVSGAHFNPAVTLALCRARIVSLEDRAGLLIGADYCCHRRWWRSAGHVWPRRAPGR
jgi:hypothetical protein